MAELELKLWLDRSFDVFETILTERLASEDWAWIKADLDQRKEGAKLDLLTYFLMLQNTNRQLNLTAKADSRDLAVIHLLDSLTLLLAWPDKWPKPGQKFVDLGTGAGLPGLVFKILFPELEVVLVDSLKKRLNFIREVADQLGLAKLDLVHGRFEDLAHQAKYRHQFSVVTARAVASLPVLLEYAAGFIQPEGAFLAMKGRQVEAELKEAEKAVRILGLGLKQRLDFELPLAEVDRSILVFKPERPLPKAYPRRPDQIKKRPL